VRFLGAYDRVSLGFPGVVRHGRVLSAPNLGNDGWTGFDLATARTRAVDGRLGPHLELAHLPSDFEPERDVTIVASQAGIEGGVALWRS